MHPIRRFVTPSILFLIIFLLSGQCASAQRTPANRRKPDSAVVSRRIPPSDTVIENRLVALALQGPHYEAMGHLVNASKNQLSLARRAWFNLLAVSVNYNDQTFAKPSNVGYVYPKYYFGLTLPIGLFFTMGPQVRTARENVKVAQANQEESARNLRMEVLSKYRTYRNYEALILLQNTIVVDQQAALTQVEQKFRDGTASIDQFSLANKAFGEEKAKLLNLQLAQDLVRLDIERIIGASLDSVIK
jgi:outer membrane protein TolC